MFLRVRHDLRRRVEARRLRVEERPAEYIQMLAFQLGAGVSDRSKGCRVACRACRRSDHTAHASSRDEAIGERGIEEIDRDGIIDDAARLCGVLIKPRPATPPNRSPILGRPAPGSAHSFMKWQGIGRLRLAFDSKAGPSSAEDSVSPGALHSFRRKGPFGRIVARAAWLPLGRPATSSRLGRRPEPAIFLPWWAAPACLPTSNVRVRSCSCGSRRAGTFYF